MGSCLSRFEPENPYPTAKVISANGDLHEYPVPVTVSQVLRSETTLPSEPSTGYFVCNSDGLYYDERIPALENGEELVGDQIYFLLPESKLEGGLTAPEMAALAVKASLAMRKAEEKGGGGRGRRRRTRKASIRISPVVEIYEGGGYDHSVTMTGGHCGNTNDVDRGRESSNEGINSSVLRSGSFRKTQRVVPLKTAKVSVRAYRTRLSTIHEGTVM